MDKYTIKLTIDYIRQTLPERLETSWHFRMSPQALDSFATSLFVVMRSEGIERATDYERIMNAVSRNVKFTPTIADIMEFVRFVGRTKAEAECYAAKLYRHLELADDRTDIIFTDRRACIAFYDIYGSHRSFLALKKCDFQERFVSEYVNCSFADHTDTIRNHYIQYAEHRRDVQPVLVIGETTDSLTERLNDVYGTGHYQLVSDAPRATPVQMLMQRQEKIQAELQSREDSLRAISEGLSELEEWLHG